MVDIKPGILPIGSRTFISVEDDVIIALTYSRRPEDSHVTITEIVQLPREGLEVKIDELELVFSREGRECFRCRPEPNSYLGHELY